MLTRKRSSCDDRKSSRYAWLHDMQEYEDELKTRLGVLPTNESSLVMESWDRQIIFMGKTLIIR